MIDFIFLIKEYRVKEGLTQKQLAIKANITQGYLHKIENNIQLPSFTVLEKLGNALGVNPLKLIKYVKRKKSKPKGALK